MLYLKMSLLFHLLLHNPEVPKTEKPAEVKYEINKKQSVLKWFGKESVGGVIEGTIELLSGKISMDGNVLMKGGSFVMDMNSISHKKPGDKSGKDGIAEHLKSDDFFSSKKFPQSYFVITKVSPGVKANEVRVIGNLTIKGVTNGIMFPAIIIKDGDKIKVQADLTFNRVLWGITYRSMNLLALVKEGLIDSDIKMKLDLVFDKVN